MYVARVVVVASEEVARDDLAEIVGPEDELFVLVPTVEQSRLEWLANDEDAARARAREVGESIGREAPADAAAVVVKPDPPDQLLRDAIVEHAPDTIVLALREGEDAAWLERDGLDRAPASIDGVPVVRISR